MIVVGSSNMIDQIRIKIQNWARNAGNKDQFQNIQEGWIMEADIICQEYPILVIFSQSGQVLKSLSNICEKWTQISSYIIYPIYRSGNIGI